MTRTAKELIQEYESTTFNGLALMSEEDLESVIYENSNTLKSVDDLNDRFTKAELENLALKSALAEVFMVIGESTGVIGFHLNGDTANWDELLETSLTSLRDAASFI